MNLAMILARIKGIESRDNQTTRRTTAKAMMQVLNAREAMVLAYWSNGFTFARIGAEMGYTRSRIQQIHAKGLRKLRRPSLKLYP